MSVSLRLNASGLIISDVSRCDADAVISPFSPRRNVSVVLSLPTHAHHP